MTGLTLDKVLFEVISAFATCGLTTGITPDLPDGAKYVLTVLMFIGRTGTMTLAAALALRNRRRVIRLPRREADHWLTDPADSLDARRRTHRARPRRTPACSSSGSAGSAPSIAATLDRLGQDVLAVERNPELVAQWAGRVPLVEADATNPEALEQLGARGLPGRRRRRRHVPRGVAC